MSAVAELTGYTEPMSIQVGRFLISNGFYIASGNGIESNSLIKAPYLGILYKDPGVKPRKYLFGLISRKPRRSFLGIIWFNHNNTPSNDEQNWSFEVLGRNHIDLAKKLAEEIASTFNAKISIRLASDQPEVETYFSDQQMV